MNQKEDLQQCINNAYDAVYNSRLKTVAEATECGIIFTEICKLASTLYIQTTKDKAKPSVKQHKYALSLMRQEGYVLDNDALQTVIRWMKEKQANNLEQLLEAMTSEEISKAIDYLKNHSTKKGGDTK